MHTPGPWFYGTDKGEKPLSYRGPGYFDNAGIYAANGETIAGCGEYEIFGPMSSDEERDANVRLMVAAPDLLEALKCVYSRLPDNLAVDLGWVEAVIAKAEGK